MRSPERVLAGDDAVAVVNFGCDESVKIKVLAADKEGRWTEMSYGFFFWWKNVGLVI